MEAFDRRKQDILSKKDKSFIGGWDKNIVRLCESINLKENYYTTSSCSGRIMVLVDQSKKSPGLFKFVSHDLVELEEFKKKLVGVKGELKFKQESPILHVVCKTLEDAEKLLEKAQLAGWKRSGIISLGKNIVVEIISTEKIEFPFMVDGKILVDNAFLEVVLEKANENLESGWLKIEKLKKLFM